MTSAQHSPTRKLCEVPSRTTNRDEFAGIVVTRAVSAGTCAEAFREYTTSRGKAAKVGGRVKKLALPLFIGYHTARVHHMEKSTITFTSIGTVHNGIDEAHHDTPWPDIESAIVLDPAWQGALEGLELPDLRKMICADRPN